MSDDRKLDPVSEDFVDAPGGAFVQVDAIENQIAFSYSIPLGSWEGDPLLGHRFHELDRAQDTVENRNLLRDFAGQAVQWLIDLGLLDHVDVTVEDFGNGRVAFEVDYFTPNSSTPKKAGPFLIPVGGG